MKRCDWRRSVPGVLAALLVFLLASCGVSGAESGPKAAVGATKPASDEAIKPFLNLR